MRQMFNIAKFLSLLLVLGAVALQVLMPRMRPEDFVAKGPRLVPEEYFNGTSKGHGVFYDRFGNLQTSFTVELRGVWDGEMLRLTELLRYVTGETLTREYVIRKLDEHHYEASTPDIEGVAKLEAFGNALKWTYTLKQAIGEKVWHLDFDDWMLLQEDGVILNRAYAKKFGVEIGEVVMSISRTTN